MCVLRSRVPCSPLPPARSSPRPRPQPHAAPQTNSSSNWAGYAIHRPGVSFDRVSAIWRQPTATCLLGTRSYSAYWVGIGGYGRRSNALEQIGTEVDCDVFGQVRSSAWFELVPAASRTIRFRVQPGDLIAATVTVTGHRVVVMLRNATEHRRFRRVLHANHVDVSSADWIVEAPSSCLSVTSCETLPLADFGTASFGLTYARTTTGHVGSISNRAWRASEISLVPSGRRFVSAGTATTVGEAIPTPLTGQGSGFSVAYTSVPIPGSVSAAARQAASRAGYLVHPGR